MAGRGAGVWRLQEMSTPGSGGTKRIVGSWVPNVRAGSGSGVSSNNYAPCDNIVRQGNSRPGSSGETVEELVVMCERLTSTADMLRDQNDSLARELNEARCLAREARDRARTLEWEMNQLKAESIVHANRRPPNTTGRLHETYLPPAPSATTTTTTTTTTTCTSQVVTSKAQTAAAVGSDRVPAAASMSGDGDGDQGGIIPHHSQGKGAGGKGGGSRSARRSKDGGKGRSRSGDVPRVRGGIDGRNRGGGLGDKNGGYGGVEDSRGRSDRRSGIKASESREELKMFTGRRAGDRRSTGRLGNKTKGDKEKGADNGSNQTQEGADNGVGGRATGCDSGPAISGTEGGNSLHSTVLRPVTSAGASVGEELTGPKVSVSRGSWQFHEDEWPAELEKTWRKEGPTSSHEGLDENACQEENSNVEISLGKVLPTLASFISEKREKGGQVQGRSRRPGKALQWSTARRKSIS